MQMNGPIGQREGENRTMKDKNAKEEMNGKGEP